VSHILKDAGKEEIEGRALIDEDYLRERWGFKDGDFVKYRLDPDVEPKRAVPRMWAPFVFLARMWGLTDGVLGYSLPSLRVEEEDEELLDTRDLQSAKKLYGKGSSAKL
jgi:hypothetical protein